MKQGQGLVETSQEEIQKQTGMTPLSPAAAKTAGANPDVAKMAGTPAAKQSLYKPLEDTQKTLQQAQRQTQMLDKQRQQAQDQAAAKMDRLKQLGTMGAQIEGLIQQRLGVQQGATSGLATQNIAAPVINQAAIDLLPETQRAAAAAALQAYAAATDVNAKQQALVSLSTTLGRPVKDSDIGDYFQQLPELATAATKQAVAAPITLGGLQPSWLNVQQTATDLGVTEAELQSYTPEQLQAKLQEVEANEYNRIANLKAEYATAVGARKLQIQNELTQLGQAGATGTEAQFDRMQQAIDEGQTLMVGGREMSLEEILTEDSISNLISDAATNPQALADLKKTPGYEALASWIETNQAELNELATGMRSDVRAFGDVQSNLAGIQSNLGNLSSVILGDIPQYATQEQLTALQDKLNSSGLYASLQADPAFKARLTADPALAEQLKDKTKEEIDTLKSITDMVKNNGTIAAEFGLNEGEFITDPAKAESFISTANALANAPEEVGEQQKIDIARMVADGDITTDVVNAMMQYPEEVDAVITENAAIKEYNSVKDDFDKFSEWAFGGQSVQATNDILATLQQIAPYDKDANRILNSFKQFVGPDGQLDKSDMGRLQAALKTVGLDKVATGGKTLAEQMAGLKKMADDAVMRTSDPGMKDIMALTSDGIVSYDELVDPNNATIAKSLLNNAYFKSTYPDVANHLKNIETVRNIFTGSNAALGEKFLTAMKDGELDVAEAKKYAKNMTIEELQKLVDSGLKMQNITKREVVSNVLGHKKYGDVAYDARADLQKMLDGKVDSALAALPGYKESNSAARAIEDLIGKYSTVDRNNTIQMLNMREQFLKQAPVLREKIEQLTNDINASGGLIKTLGQKRLADMNRALLEAQWWETHNNVRDIANHVGAAKGTSASDILTGR